MVVEEGSEWTREEEISIAFVNFYQKLFTFEGTIGKEECLEGLLLRVTEAMNARLIQKFEMAEIDSTLGQMHPLKSLGLDGFAACFYQHSWGTVRNSICKAVLEFLNDGNFDNSINEAYIAFIPKMKKPFANYRISAYQLM